jgi:homoserine dehydrogenase
VDAGRPTVTDGGAVRVALLGCGTVGSEIVRLLREQAAEFAARAGAPVELAGVAVRRPHKHPELGDLLTTDAHALVTRPDVDVVVEVIGGIEPARTLLLEALKAGKSVVTANKALLAEDGAALAEAADSSGADLFYEASVAGAIPLLRPLRESLAGDRITRVAGIVNGTTNFILSAMTESGSSYGDALGSASA